MPEVFDARTKSPQQFRCFLSFVARASQPTCLRLLHFANTLHQTVKTSSALRRLKPPTTTASADFCGDINAPLETSGLSDYVARASLQISQGKTRNFPPANPPHLRRLAPNDIGLRVSWPSRPASRRLVCGWWYAHGEAQVDEGGILLAFQSTEIQRCLEVVSSQNSGPSRFRTIPSATSPWLTSAQTITSLSIPSTSGAEN
jgi:hypothetical protein